MRYACKIWSGKEWLRVVNEPNKNDAKKGSYVEREVDLEGCAQNPK